MPLLAVVAAQPTLADATCLTGVEYGLLTGIVFTVVYSVFGLLLAPVPDRVNKKNLLAAGVFLWSLASAVSDRGRRGAVDVVRCCTVALYTVHGVLCVDGLKSTLCACMCACWRERPLSA